MQRLWVVKMTTSRRPLHLACMATVMMLITTGSSEARAQERRGDADLEPGHHRWYTRSPLGRSSTPGGSVPVCSEIPRSPLDRCGAHVGVTVTADEAPVPSFTWHAVHEMNLIRSLERGAQAAAERRRLVGRPVTLYGIESEPVFQLQLKREMLVLLARFTGEGAIGRAATGLTPTSTIRVIAEGQADQRTHDRATFIQIEDFRGPNPLMTPVAVQAGFAALGAGFFWGGLAGEKLLHHALGDALVIHPQPWPPGLQIKGSFDVP